MKDQQQPLGRDEDSGPGGTPEPSTVGRQRGTGCVAIRPGGPI